MHHKGVTSGNEYTERTHAVFFRMAASQSDLTNTIPMREAETEPADHVIPD